MPPTDYRKVEKIKELKAKGLNQSQIAVKLGCTQTNISSICRTHSIRWDRGAAARDQRGKNNPNYIDGLSKSSVERLTRQIVIDAGRSLYLCESCGDLNKFQEQQRHHKDRDRSNNVSSNIKVLCSKCHRLEHISEHKRDSSSGRFVS
jgi:5-methylcytosine-specific restriction endonuclease McrA